MGRVLLALGAALALTFLLTPAASAANGDYARKCAESNRVCGLVHRDNDFSLIYGVGTASVPSGKICLLGVALWVDGQPRTGSGEIAPGTNCATSGHDAYARTEGFGIDCADTGPHTFYTHVKYLINGATRVMSSEATRFQNRISCA